MGLLDRLKPLPLLRSGPLLLLPSGTSPETVDALVASWAPLRRRKGDAWQLADGLRWIGPVEVTMSDVTEHDLPGGYPIASIAQAKRSRGDGLAGRMLDKTTMNVDGVYFETGKRTPVAEGACRFFPDAPGEQVVCGARIDKDGVRTVAIVGFKGQKSR